MTKWYISSTTERRQVFCHFKCTYYVLAVWGPLTNGEELSNNEPKVDCSNCGEVLFATQVFEMSDDLSGPLEQLGVK